MAMVIASPWTGISPSRRIPSFPQAHPCLPSRHWNSCARYLLPSPHCRLNLSIPLSNSHCGKNCRAPRQLSIAHMTVVQGEHPSVGLKDFLEDLKAVGRIRLIVNTGVAVLESVTNLDKLFYHTLPGRGEYANLMLKEDNVDFHLLIDQVASAKLVTGTSSRGDIPTYMVRFVDNDDTVAVSLLVMWQPGTNGAYDDGQVDAFQGLLDKYGPEITFTNGDSEASVPQT